MPKDINQAVREVCLWLPESEEFVSHGAPSFRVRGKVYANYALNVHGDRRIDGYREAAILDALAAVR